MRFCFAFLFGFSSFVLWAQPKQNSPYSRYGVGDLAPQYFAAAAGMGGQTAAFHDPYHLNLANPASYAFLRATALETVLYAKRSHYTSSVASSDATSGNLAYLALGFTLKSPINEVLDKNKSPWQFGMGLSATPHSTVGYNVESQERRGSAGVVYSAFEGRGGLYRLQWSSAAKYKNTAFGLNLGWSFGRTIYENNTQFRSGIDTTDATAFQSNFRDEFRMKGFVWGLGVQQDLVLQYANAREKANPSKWITIGAAMEAPHTLNIVADQLRIRSRGRLFTGAYSDPDTLVKVLGQKGSLRLPGNFTVGVQYTKANKFKAGLQTGYENASVYNNPFRPETLRNGFHLSGGLEYIPDYISYNKFLRRMRYRAGAYYRQDPRVVNGNGVSDMGITLGLGLPVLLPRQQTSFVNFALEGGILGDGTPIREQYLRVTLGFTMNDNTWFYKRRFE